MSKSENPATAREATVTPIREAPAAVDPPDGWELHSSHGYMSTDGTPAGRLVRLIDVLKWLQRACGLPFKRVVGLLCDALTPDAAAWLFLPEHDDFAKPLPLDYGFFDDRGPEFYGWDDPPRQPDGRGLPGLKRAMHKQWIEAPPYLEPIDLDRDLSFWEGSAVNTEGLKRISILMVRAHALWGICKVTTPTPLRPSAVVSDPAIAGLPTAAVPAWELFKPQRRQGYGGPLYQFLASKHATGEGCPSARDVLDAWTAKQPSGIHSVEGNELKYYDGEGNIKTAKLKVIQQAIKRLTTKSKSPATADEAPNKTSKSRTRRTT